MWTEYRSRKESHLKSEHSLINSVVILITAIVWHDISLPCINSLTGDTGTLNVSDHLAKPFPR